MSTVPSRHVRLNVANEISGYDLPQQPVPGWLTDLDPEPCPQRFRLQQVDLALPDALDGRIPLRNILAESFFYPGCGHDGRLLKYTNGFVHSFVHVDLWTRRESYQDELFGSPDQNPHAGIRGYHCILCHEFDFDDLLPFRRTHRHGQPARRHGLPERETFHRCGTGKGMWTVWQRNPGFDDQHGSERFSLLFINMDACTFYAATYNHLGIRPLVAAFFLGMVSDLIPKLRSVFAENRAGMPFLLMAGAPNNGRKHLYPFGRESAWPDLYGPDPVCPHLGMFPLKQACVDDRNQADWHTLTRPWRLTREDPRHRQTLEEEAAISA